MNIHELTDSDSGRYTVRTEHSTYLIDLDARTMRRIRVNAEAAITAGDGEAVQLDSILRCEAGLGALFSWSHPDDDHSKIRQTTVVTEIEVGWE